MLSSVFHYGNNDATLDLNDRFRAFINRGILAGGEINPVVAQLNITISPFTAMSVDGMLIMDTAVTTLAIPLNQTSVVSAFAQYTLGGASVLNYVVTEASVFNALPDKKYHIVFGTITVNSPATFITVANISYALRDLVDYQGRSPFRGWLTSSALLPLDNPSGTNRPADFFIINAGVGDLPEIHAWDGVVWQNITNTLSIAADLTAHRNNLFPNEIHLTDNQADAALGSAGAPSFVNKYVTELDTRLPTQNENDALQGDFGSPSSTNKYVTESYPVSAAEILSFPLPPGGAIELTAVNGPFFVGKDGVGTANGLFSLMDFSNSRGYINSVLIAPAITGVFKDGFLTVALDPSVDGDSEGYYSSGNLYLQVSTVVDTSFRVVYGKKEPLKTLNRGFSITSTPGDEYIPSKVVEKIINIKGRLFDDTVPAREQNINIRSSVDSISSYLGSVLETNVIASDEDYTRLKDEAVIGANFVKNVGILPIYTFQNTGLVGLSYNNVTGRVTYSSPVNLSAVAIGNLFVDGLGRDFKIVAVNDGLDTVDIVSVDTGLIPSSINTSVGTAVNGSTKKNNNPRNLLLSEMKLSHEVERFPVLEVFQNRDEFSKPDGRIAYVLKKNDGRPESRIVFFGSFENFENQYRERYVRCSGTGKIVLTGFFDKVSVLLRRKPNAPSLLVSTNEEVGSLVSTSTDGTAINTNVSSARGERYQRLIISSGHNPLVVTTVSAEITTPTADPLEIYGIEFIVENCSTSLLESGRAFENAELVKIDNIITTIPVPFGLTSARGSRTLIAVQAENYTSGNSLLADLDGMPGTSTGLSITGVGSTKLSGYKANDLIYVESSFVSVIRKILSIVGTTINLDSNTGFIGSVSIYHICSLDNSIPSTEEEETIRYYLPTDFINYTGTDLETQGPINRYVLHKDGHTLLSGENLEVTATGISGVAKALRINSSGNLKLLVTGTRVDVVVNNTSSATVNIKIDGSPNYSFSFAGNGAQRRTIFLNAKYQTHEIQISPTAGSLSISEIIFFGPSKPVLSGFPNVVADIPVLATYKKSDSKYLVAPNVYPFGGVFYDAFHYMSYFNGTGVNADWSVTDNFSKAVYGRYVVSENDGSFAKFTFFGGAFELSYITGPDHGNFKVELDGVDLGALPPNLTVGGYSLGVDAYSASYGRKNISVFASGAGFNFGFHEVKVFIESPRTKNVLSTGYNVGLVGFWSGNWVYTGSGSFGPVSFGLTRQGGFSSYSDVRNFVALPLEKILVDKLPVEDGLVRAQRVTIPVSSTTLSVVFTTQLPDSNYVLNINWLNTTDANPLFQPIVVDSYTNTGFTIKWNYPLITSNYQILYITTGLH